MKRSSIIRSFKLSSIYLIIAVFALFSCKSGQKEQKEESGELTKREFKAEKNYVDTVVISKRDFKLQMISNGKLKAVEKTSLKFGTSGEILSINVKNGSVVRKGELIAKIDPSPAKLKLEQAQATMEKAELDFADNILGFGYGRDTSKLTPEMLNVARIRSGYSSAKNNLKQAQLDYRNTELRAPFSGKIANLTSKVHDFATGDICTLINDKEFEVEFTLLETELSFIKIGTVVQISSFANPQKSYPGKVSQINPIVDDKGQVKIIARLSNSDSRLIEGMNVRVIAENTISGKFVVPKSAVVIRDNKTVLFRYNPESKKAMWTYVIVEHSNASQHSVIADSERESVLNSKDIVIVSGNLNLAEGSDVEIKKK